MCKKITLSLLLLCSSELIMADSIYLGGWSTHIGGDSDYNENHRLIAYERGKYLYGYARNSFNRDVYYASRKFLVPQSLVPININIHTGAIYGYLECVRPTKTAVQKGKHSKLCLMLAAEFTPTTGYFIKPSVLIVGNSIIGSFKIDF